MKVLAPIDLSGNELRNANAQNLGTDPAGLAAGDAGRLWFNTSDGKAKVWTGTASDLLTNLIESILGSGPVTASAVGKQVTIGLQSSAANNPNTVVQRDSSGNFSAGTITAALTGTASNAAALGGQSLAQVRDFALTTGTRDATAISNFSTAVRGNRLDQMAAPTAPVVMGNQRITSLADPSGAQDAATKSYVDSVATGLDVKASVRAATTAPLPASTYANGANGVGATLTATANGVFPTNIDGYTFVGTERILVKNEATAANNGIYVITQLGSASTPWILTRATDADTLAKLNGGTFTFIERGTTLGATGWTLNSANPPTVGTSPINFVQFSGSGSYSAGNGLSLSGSILSVVGTANRISVGGSGVDIASNYVGQTSITTLGTITTGTWTGTEISVQRGGTGSTTAAGARTALGAAGKASANIPSGASFAYTHNLGTTDVVVAVQEVASKAIVYPDFEVTSANTVTITFGAAVAANAYRVVVVG